MRLDEGKGGNFGAERTRSKEIFRGGDLKASSILYKLLLLNHSEGEV